jgi:putative transposase
VQGRKRHLLIETLGLLLAVLVTAAPVSDPAGARLLFARLGGACKKLRLIWVDGGYHGHRVEWVAEHRRFILRVTLRPDGWKGFGLLPRCCGVEHTWAWLNQSHRLRKDYDRLPKSSEAMIYLSMTRLMLRRLAAA